MTPSAPASSSPSASPISACFGDCADCGRPHALPVGNARGFALDLMRDLESTQRLDLDLDDANANPEYALSNVIRPGYGNMFGVMECEGAKGETVVLRAFSSLQYGIRRIEGWVLPLLDAVVYEGTILPAQDEIKSLTARMEATVKGSAEYQETHNCLLYTSPSPRDRG